MSSLGILLAAGASRRMNRPKLALGLSGRTLLERSLSALVEAVDDVRIVTSPSSSGALAAESRPGLTVLVNDEAEEGIASSIRAGLVDLPAEVTTLVIALADMPFVRPETIRALVAERERTGAPVVYPVFEGKRGNPVAWDRGTESELSRLEGDRGAATVIVRLGSQAVALPVEDPGVLEDVDTPEDLESFRSR